MPTDALLFPLGAASLGWCILFAFLLGLVTELLYNRGSLSITLSKLFRIPGVFAVSTLPTTGLCLLWAGLTGSLVLGCSITLVMLVLLGYSSALMLRYRDEPIVPRDLAMLLNVNRLLTMISPLSVLALSLGLLAAAGGAIALYSLLPRSAYTLIQRLMLVGIGGAVCAFFVRSGRRHSMAAKLFCLCGADFSPYHQEGNALRCSQRNGCWVSFLYQCLHPVMALPEGYSPQAVEQVTESYIQKATCFNRSFTEVLPSRPHILFVMNEAFSDPTRINGLRFSADPIPRVRSIMRGTPSGLALCPGFGGGTAHCEFEALTGFPVGLANGLSLFENNVNRQKAFPGFPRRLLEQGYHTLALHPYKRGMYARTEAYRALGFQEFIDITCMRHRKTPDNSPYVSDREAYREALGLLKASARPTFLHLVTMQNHGDYIQKDRYHNTIQVEGLASDKDRQALETYTQGIRYTDEATWELLEELRGWDQDVLVVFWGDHLPGVYPSALAEKLGREKFETPFFIWCNYSISPEHLGVCSPALFPAFAADYAGLPRSPLDSLQWELRTHLPGIHNRFLVDGQGNTTTAHQLDAETANLLHSLKLLQYDTLLGDNIAARNNFFSHESIGVNSFSNTVTAPPAAILHKH